MAISNIQTTSVINATDSANGLKPSAYYDKILLKVLRATDFKHRMFAKKKNLPKNYGDTINFRTYKKLDPKLTPLTEATLDVSTVVSETFFLHAVNEKIQTNASATESVSFKIFFIKPSLFNLKDFSFKFKYNFTSILL